MLATVLAAAAGFAILPYSAIGILSPLIIEDSGMTRAQLGWLLTVIAFTGAVMAPVLGRAADLVDGRLGIVALFAVGCLSFVALGVAPNYAVLLGACAGAGVAQGAAHPATNKLISDHISPGRRGVITGIKVSGNQFAILIGGVLLPAGALIVGWRATLYGVAGAGVLAMAYSSRAVPKDSVTRPVGRVDVASGRMPAAVWWLTAFSFIMGTGGSAAMAFFPLYAYEELGFPVTAAGSLVALGGLVSIVGRITLGRFSEQSGRYVDMLSAFAGSGSPQRSCRGALWGWADGRFGWVRSCTERAWDRGSPLPCLPRWRSHEPARPVGSRGSWDSDSASASVRVRPYLEGSSTSPGDTTLHSPP